MKLRDLCQACNEWGRVAFFAGMFLAAVYGVVLMPPAMDAALLAMEANGPAIVPDKKAMANLNASYSAPAARTPMGTPASASVSAVMSMPIRATAGPITSLAQAR